MGSALQASRRGDSQRDRPRLVLASSSSRRIELLRQEGYVFEVMAPPREEPDASGRAVSPAQQAEALAYYKARSVAGLCRDALILAADTLVAHAGRVFGKPADADEARRILSHLAGTRTRPAGSFRILRARGTK